MSNARRLLLALPVPILLLVLWHLSVDQAWELWFDIRMGSVPAPSDVAVRLWDFAFGGDSNVFSGTLLVQLWASTSRVLTGFALAVLVAVPLGALMGSSRTVSAVMDPTISLIRPVPVTAWVPLVLIVVGLGHRATVMLVFLAAFYPVLLNTIAGVRAVPPRLLEAAAMLGTRPTERMQRVVLPAALPSILAGMRIALGFGWVIVVVGETVGVPDGLGAVIIEARETSQTALIVAGMVYIGLAGFITDRVMTGLIQLSLRNRPVNV